MAAAPGRRSSAIAVAQNNSASDLTLSFDHSSSSFSGRSRQPSRARAHLRPKQYADAVREYSKLRTGAGQNYTDLGNFLTSTQAHTTVDIYNRSTDAFVIVRYLQSDHSNDRRRGDNSIHFSQPSDFFAFRRTPDDEAQSRIIFLRGYMSADWLNNVGARHMIDPELFRRHLVFLPPGDASNQFSIPALPSSSWRLIQLHVITLGSISTSLGPLDTPAVQRLRDSGADALASHHHKISRLATSQMRLGESMVRDFYTLDETHFAIDQGISICLEESGNTFTLVVWLDGGQEFDEHSNGPWSFKNRKSTQGRLLPVIRHRHGVALKSHLFSDSADAKDSDAPRPQTMSGLHVDYGRSLRDSVMAADAFYALNEIFSFVAASQSDFLNLVDAKIDRFISSEISESDSLLHLRYTKDILYRQIQKLQWVQDSINSTKVRQWPKAQGRDGERADIACNGVEQDFRYLLGRAQVLHKRCSDEIASLNSSISIAESQKAIEQAREVGRLTFLAFIFVPMSFTTSFFGMNVRELQSGKLSIYYWATLTVPVLVFALMLFYIDFGRRWQVFVTKVRTWWES